MIFPLYGKSVGDLLDTTAIIIGLLLNKEQEETGVGPLLNMQ